MTIQTYGDPDGMSARDVPEPRVEPDQLLIGTEAIGVGGVDAVIRRGTVGGGAFGVGHVPGSEVAGTVLAVGDDIDDGWVGRHVWAFTGLGGAYAERAVARLEDVVALPDGLSSVDAVTIGSAAPVAHFALEHGRFVAGARVLIRGAAGSIGIAAVELAARAGASAVAVTTSSPARGERLRTLGATEVLDRSGKDAALRTDGQFDVILDIAGGPELPDFLERLAPNGRFVLVGVVAGYPPPDFGTSLFGLFQRSLSFSTFSLDTVSRPDLSRVRRELFDAVGRGELHPVVHDILPLERAADAHRVIDQGEVFGRIVLTTS
ncbi:zinc-binding dehydrogenase [Aeromicrobium panaciterrae]